MRTALALWTCPRSVSTAFGVMMIERGDFKVLHEPYGPAYYLSEQRQSDRKQGEPPQPEHNYDVVTGTIETLVADGPVFLKDMAYYVEPVLDEGFLARFENTLLIRNPLEQLPSLYRSWPDFTMAETGYPALHRVATIARDATGRMPPIIDAADLVAAPAETVAAYCRAVDIPFRPEALTWEARERPELNWWEGGSWHGTVSASTGFTTRPRTDEAADAAAIERVPTLREACAHCAPLYRELYEHRLRPLPL
jgi:hypothetical protein